MLSTNYGPSDICTDIHIVILGRTYLRIGASGATFDAESDVEVEFAVDPRKQTKKLRKLFFPLKI